MVHFYLFIRDHHSGPFVRFQAQTFQSEILDEIQPGVTALPHGGLNPEKSRYLFNNNNNVQICFSLSFSKLGLINFFAKWLKKECLFLSYCLILLHDTRFLSSPSNPREREKTFDKLGLSKIIFCMQLKQ